MTEVTPIPKPRKRIKDPGASKRKLAYDPLCRVCHRRATNCHHILGKAQGGDDVPDALIPLCGSGAAGCHGALHGNPSTHAGRRWDARSVRVTIGTRLSPSEYHYVLERLGSRAAVWLADQYGVEVVSISPLRLGEVTE